MRNALNAPKNFQLQFQIYNKFKYHELSYLLPNTSSHK